MRRKKLKRSLCFLLTMCMVLGGLQMPGNVNMVKAEGETQASIVNLNFESDTVGTFPADNSWGKIIYTTDDSAVEVKEVNDNKLLSVSSQNANTILVYDLGTAYEKLTLSYYVAILDNRSLLYLPTLSYKKVTTGKNALALIAAWGSAGSYKLQYSADASNWSKMKNSDTQTQLDAYENIIWYKVKLEYDENAADGPGCKVYINDILTDTGITAYAAGTGSDEKEETGIRYLFMRVPSGGGTMYIDNLCVTAGDNNPEAPAELVFESAGSCKEDFENTEIGALPDNIKIYNLEGDTTAGVIEEDDNKVLKISQPAHQTNSLSAMWTYDLTSTATKAVLKYKVKAEADNGYVFLPRFAENGGVGKLTYLSKWVTELYKDNNDGKSWVAVAPMEKGQWHDIELIVDVERDVYDLYLNGEPVIIWNPLFSTEASKINLVQFGIYKQTVNTMYIDDLEVVPFVEGESIAFDNAPTEVALGTTTELKVKFTPEDTSFRNVKYSSSNPDVATIDESGNLTALTTGTTTITATPYLDGVTPATVEITVKEVAVEDIIIENVENGTVALPVGGHMFLEAHVEPVTAGFSDIVYSSNNETVATIDQWGEIIAIGTGTATITLQADAYENVTETVVVNVSAADVMKRIYVAPNGTGSGESEADPTSIAGAMAAIASVNASQERMTGNIEVILADGYYQQTDTIAFTQEHSGTNHYSVIWKAAAGATPVIGGGIHMEGSDFTDADNDGIYVVSVADGVATRQLYVDNVRATRARSEGSLTNPVFNADYGYICDNTELLNYKNITDLELVYYQNWTNSRCGVAAVEATEDSKVKVTMDDPGWSYVTTKNSATSTSASTTIAWYENAIELLDKPGEWYLDEVNNKLYYMPRQWESMANVTVTIPVVEELVTIYGSEDYENMVENIDFEGITFADTTWMYPSSENGHAEVQNNHLREYITATDRLPEAAVTVKRANSVSFTGCTFTRMGSTALKLVEGVQNSPITGNHFYDISASAINIGNPGYKLTQDVDNYYPSDLRKMMKNCDVTNNYIHEIAEEYEAAAAVSVGFAADMNLSYNEIFNIPYCAFHIGYGWGTKFDNFNKNMVISHNFIHDVMDSEIYDGGAIYTLGNTGDGDGTYNVISDNYIRRQMQGPAPLYSDNGSTYWEVTRNVVDLSEVEEWTNGLPVQTRIKWNYVNDPAEHLHFSDIYTTTQNKDMSTAVNPTSSDVTFEGIRVYETAEWPQEALDIINASGLQTDYVGLRNNYAERVVTAEEITLEVGETSSVAASFTDGKDNMVTGGEGVVVYYEVADVSVAEVSSTTGAITAKAAGQTTVYVYVVSNDILRVAEVDVYVGDELTILELTGFEDSISLVNGTEGKQLEVYVETAMGRNPELTSVVYSIADVSVATVDANGLLKPVGNGTTTLTVTVTAEEQEISKVFDVTITNTLEGLELYDLSDIFMAEKDAEWAKSGVTTWDLVDDTSITTVMNGYATFGGAKYGDEVFSLKVFVSEDGGTWPSLVLRAQNTTTKMTASGSTGYLFCITADGLELHRFNDGVRTCIYGDNADWAPDGGTGGHLISPQPIKRGEEHDVQIGAVNVDGGVRIITVVDGVPVIDFVDTGDGVITEDGYFGLVGKNETIILTKDTDLPDVDAGSGTKVDIQISNSTAIGTDATTGATINGPEGGWLEGENTFTVSHDKACVVLVSNNGGTTYTRLAATETATANCYSYTTDVDANTQITVALVGDVNGDGKTNAADVTRLRAACLDKITLDAVEEILGDTNGDSKMNAADVTRLRAVCLDKATLNW